MTIDEVEAAVRADDRGFWTAQTVLAALREDAGHRVDGEHDCFNMNCRGMQHEIETLRARLQAASEERAG